MATRRQTTPLPATGEAALDDGRRTLPMVV